MKPKYLCSECESELRWGDKFCASCGNSVEWPESESEPSSKPAEKAQAATSFLMCEMCGSENSPDAERCSECGASLGSPMGRKTERKRESDRRSSSKKMAREPGALGSWKLLLGFIAFIAIGVFVLETFTGKGRVPETGAPIKPAAGANLQALSQIEEMEKRVAANPNDASQILQLAHLLHDNRFFDKAIASYKQYLDLNPKDADARVDMGICYHEIGNQEEAKRQMERALKDNPKHLLAYFNLGIVNLSAGNIEEANEWFRKTVALAPNSEVAQQAQRILTQHSNLPKSTIN